MPVLNVSTGCRQDDWEIRGVSHQGKRFLSSLQHPEFFQIQLSLLPSRFYGLSQRLKHLGCISNLSSLCIAWIKNAKSCASTSFCDLMLWCFVMDMDNFTFLLILDTKDSVTGIITVVYKRTWKLSAMILTVEGLSEQYSAHRVEHMLVTPQAPVVRIGNYIYYARLCQRLT